MLNNEKFYNDYMDDLLQAMLNKGKLQEDIRNAKALEPKAADVHWRYGSDVIVIERTCRVTGEEFTLDVTRQEWDSWKGGKDVQAVWPTMPKDHREIIQTGWTPAEWEVIFND